MVTEEWPTNCWTDPGVDGLTPTDGAIDDAFLAAFVTASLRRRPQQRPHRRVAGAHRRVAAGASQRGDLSHVRHGDRHGRVLTLTLGTLVMCARDSASISSNF